MKNKAIAVGVSLALAVGVLWIGRTGFAGEKESGAAETKQKPAVTSSEAPGKSLDAPGQAHEMNGLHGGMVAMTKQHHFETTLAPDGVRIFAYTAEQAPMMIEKATGTASLVSKDGKKVDVALVKTAPAEGEPAVYFCPMHKDVVQKEPGVCQQCGGMKLYTQDYLFGKTDLSKVDLAATKVMVQIKDLPGEEKQVTFAQGFQEPGTPAAGKPAAEPSSHEGGGEGKDH